MEENTQIAPEHAPWHTLTPSQALEALGSSAEGLSADEAASRLQAAGPNALPEAKPESIALTFLKQFQSPLIYLLLAAAASVVAIGEVSDGIIILIVLLFNACIGTFQEGRAQNTLRALKHLVETTARVLRGGAELIIPDKDLVPGDILVLEEGARVPADARVTVSYALKADESSLTGESVPVHKTVEAMKNPDAPIAEQHTMLFKGTSVVAGAGRAVVVATGLSTHVGGIAKEIAAIESDVPLKADIRALSRVIIAVVFGVSVLLFVLGIWQGDSVLTMFATVVSLAVSVIPEGLPIVMTLVLASGVWRMSKRNVLVKKLQAVEALGQARIIAVDKTGTITKNELTVERVWAGGKLFDIRGSGYEPKGAIALEGNATDAADHPDLLLCGRVATLCASARPLYSEDTHTWRVAGDPTEAAMYVFGQKVGFHHDTLEATEPRLGEIPFDYKLKYHAVLHGGAKTRKLFVTGAPEELLALATHQMRDGVSRTLSAHDKEELVAVFERLSERGLRVIACALREDAPEMIEPSEVRSLTFAGFLGMKDALRPEVHDATARAEEAGIRVVMITGDHVITARAIAKEAGIFKQGDKVLTGKDIDTIAPDDLPSYLGDTSVFARVTPEHKLRIIQAYKKKGMLVAMTGDGVNDAPSLVAADLGVAMGGIGTEVAKEAADLVLLDDNFGSIVSAVEEGRGIYRSVQRVILYLFSTSAGEALTIVGALALGFPLPLLPVQIIWLNFITDPLLDVALAMEPQSKHILRGTFTRPKRYLVSGVMIERMVLMALPMAVGSVALFVAYLDTTPEKAWTMALTIMAVFQWFNAWNCRSEHRSVFAMNPLSNKYLIGATAMVVALQLSAVYVPFLQNLLHTVPLSLYEWLFIIAIASSIVVVEEGRKALYRLRTAPQEA